MKPPNERYLVTLIIYIILFKKYTLHISALATERFLLLSTIQNLDNNIRRYLLMMKQSQIKAITFTQRISKK